jgi:hypothetical protein
MLRPFWNFILASSIMAKFFTCNSFSIFME